MRRCQLSKSRTVDIRADSVEAGVVERVEAFASKLETEPFADLKLFSAARSHSCSPGPNRTPIPSLPNCPMAVCERACVEPLPPVARTGQFLTRNYVRPDGEIRGIVHAQTAREGSRCARKIHRIERIARLCNRD